MSGKTMFVDGPLAGQGLSEAIAVDRVEGDDWGGYYEAVYVVFYDAGRFQLDVRREYRYRDDRFVSSSPSL